MTTEETKRDEDIAIVVAMSEELEDYLRHDVLFWPMSVSTMPRLTLGGLFMRLHRLSALRDQLTPEKRTLFDQAQVRVNDVLANQTVATEQRAHQEIEARLRQWQTSMRDWLQNAPTPAFYATSVEVRVILSALFDKLSTPPYRLDSELIQRLQGLDQALRGRWQSGEFIWPSAWQPAYPHQRYWWLYGLPK